MAPAQIMLRKILGDRNICNLIEISLDENKKFETFVGQRRLVPIAIAYMVKLRLDNDGQVIKDTLRYLKDSAVHCKNSRAPLRYRSKKPRYRKFFKLLISLVRELRVIFTIPKQHMLDTSPLNEVVMVFIDFLLQILEEIMRLEPDFIVPVKGSIQNLRTELGFLITFLGDAPMRLQSTQNILSDIKVVVNEVGSLLYTLFSTRDDEALETGRLSHALSDFFPKFELLKTKIKEHCITVSKLPGSVSTQSSAVSFISVDSLLDDLEDLINYKADRIVGVEDQIIVLYEDLKLLRSTLNDGQLEELVIRTRNMAHEIEYVINSFPPVWYLSLRLPQLKEKIQLIKTAIQEKKSSIDHGLPEEEYRREQVPPQAKEPSNLEDIFVGLKEAKAKIAEQLVRGPQQQQVISIAGMPGLGKTTLAKKLFNDPSIVNHFHKCAWCVVSQSYKKTNLLIDILSSTTNLNRETMMKMEDETLAEELYKSIKGLRYLIVMDDVWDKQPWKDLGRYFPDDRTGSRILFTTRNKEVAFSGGVNELPFLSETESWELLKRKVFQTETCPPELLEIGKQIASNCHGLPLSVIAISSVLANMEKKVSSWQTVAGSLSSHILDNTNNCMHILKLSYQHLSVHLKPCFLYFGVFEEDEVIPVRKLISLWVAEGFINKENNKSSEDVAHDYLMDLINRGLVLVAEERSNGGVKTCIIHDLLHDMCLRIAKEESFMEGIKNGSTMYEQDGSVYEWAYLAYPRPFGPHVFSQLGRRVMDLSRSNSMSLNDISRGVEQLVHLRYLAVPRGLPSIENLHKLEYLVVKNKEQVGIPEIILSLKNLKHLHFRGGAHFTESCHSRATKDGSFQIKNLQSISSLCIRDEMDAKVLGCAPNLQRLKCKFTSRCPFQFPDQLESLNISSMSDSGPDFPLHLKKLTLCEFYLTWEKVRMIGRLPKLEVLKLHKGIFKEYQWDTKEGEFKKLKFFELKSVTPAATWRHVKWDPTRDDYPELERLVLRNCTHLWEIPSGLGYISTLRMIEVYGCWKLLATSAMRILDEQRDDGNEVLKVIISQY